MLEKLNDPAFKTVSRPDSSVMNYLGQILTYEADPVFYEIGVGVGATTLSVAKLLNNRGEIVLFSREQDVRELAEDLLKICCRRSILPISMEVTSFILMRQPRAY